MENEEWATGPPGRRAVAGRGPRAAGPSGRRAAGPSGRWAAGPWRAVGRGPRAAGRGPLGRGPAFSKTLSSVIHLFNCSLH